jgi:glycosyltransferase involved in cell wall biosynthesis
MTLNELTETSLPALARGRACVVVATSDAGENLHGCLESAFAHTPPDVAIVLVAPNADGEADLHAVLEECGDGRRSIWLGPGAPDFSSDAAAGVGSEAQADQTDPLTAAVNRALALLWPSDVAMLSEPCRVTAGWLARLRDAAHADTNIATASALADVGTALALSDRDRPTGDLSKFAQTVAEHTLALRPRLSLLVGPCVYVRRGALELVGSLDAQLELRWALEVDFAQRCLLAGLAHVAADDVLIGTLIEKHGADSEIPLRLRKRYPHLSQPAETEASSVLSRAMEAARRPRSRLWVTIDARALDATITGTQRHILEMIRSLAATQALRLRLLVGPNTRAADVELLHSLPQTELLPIGSIGTSTAPSTIFHRPQQAFEPADLRLALRLGERVVVNQLDLIAYRNPGYHRDRTAWESYRRVTRQALAAAERIVVSSNHTRSELLSDELADEQRIRIVPPGLDHPPPGEGRRPARLNGIRATKTALAEDTPFLLCLGTDFRHKNRLFALRLLASLRERHGWEGRLVLAGTHIPHGSSLELERDLLAHHPPLAEAVIELGAIDEQEKAWLMGRASAVVYPSVYEGFGLVPFEAAMSGVPCLFASQSSLAEVLPADMAAIVAWDPDESAARAFELLQDPVARKQHVQALLDAARSLTWKNTAEAMVDVYHEAAVAPVREAKVLSEDEVEREHDLRELIAAQDALVERLVFERKHTQRMYDELNAEVGSGLSLIGPHGTLPEDLQRALLALSDRPALSRPLYGTAARAFRAARALARTIRRLLRRPR